MSKLTEKLVLARARANDLSGVKTLNCWGCGLADVSILESVQNVEVINASVNEIESLKPFSHCTKLKELYLRRNKIQNVEELSHLKELDNLKLLWLSGNPFCESMSEDEYRSTVIKNLPQIQKLDNISVSSSELQKALQDDLEEKDDDTNINDEGQTDTSSKNINDDSSVSLARFGESVEKESPIVNPSQINSIAGDLPNTSEDLSNNLPPGGGDAGQTQVESAVQMSLDETNQLRLQLGLKPISVSKFGSSMSQPFKPPRRHKKVNHRNNILTATLALVEELSEENLLVVQDVVQDRLDLLNIQRTNEKFEDKVRELIPS